MDPTICYRSMIEAIKNKDWIAAQTHCSYLIKWLEKGGFPPELTDQELREVFLIALYAPLHTENFQ